MCKEQRVNLFGGWPVFLCDKNLYVNSLYRTIRYSWGILGNIPCLRVGSRIYCLKNNRLALFYVFVVLSFSAQNRSKAVLG